MKFLCSLVISFAFALTGVQAQKSDADIEQRNKELARGFYQDLWLSDNTDKYVHYLADEYVVHDIGDRKGVTEPAIEQKDIADRFWDNGELTGEIDYQLADGDLVATRWRIDYQPQTFMGHFVYGESSIPIINVFRFNEEGKIVEIWNHRHDIDTGFTKFFVFQGLGIGLFIALLVAVYAFTLKRKIKRLQQSS